MKLVRGQDFLKITFMFGQELVEMFNFHQFDNMKYAEEKLDPTVHELDDQGLSRVTLMFAATSGDVFGLQKHYLEGHDLGTPDYDGRTPLHAAAMSGQMDSVEFLLQIAGVDPEPIDRWDRTPLDDARRFKHAEVVEYMEEFLRTAKEAEEETGEEDVVKEAEGDDGQGEGKKDKE